MMVVVYDAMIPTLPFILFIYSFVTSSRVL